VARESLQIMAGLFWDLGEPPARQALAANRKAMAQTA
jgi:hypothetical protein